MVKGDRIYEADSYGHIKYGKPSYAIGKDGKVVQLDPYGNKLYGKPQLNVVGAKVYETDAYGNVRHQKFQIKAQTKK